jgi:hypothetical protein
MDTTIKALLIVVLLAVALPAAGCVACTGLMAIGAVTSAGKAHP